MGDVDTLAFFSALATGAAVGIVRKGLLPAAQAHRIALAVVIGVGLAAIFWLINETPMSQRAIGLSIMQALALTAAVLGVFFPVRSEGAT